MIFMERYFRFIFHLSSLLYLIQHFVRLAMVTHFYIMIYKLYSLTVVNLIYSMVCCNFAHTIYTHTGHQLTFLARKPNTLELLYPVCLSSQLAFSFTKFTLFKLISNLPYRNLEVSVVVPEKIWNLKTKRLKRLDMLNFTRVNLRST